jgi:alkylation response protein AidB-like acyl-CoA dehydrogenase
MDVRLSSEQEALRDSAARVVDRLGPTTVAALDDDERRAKLDAAVAAAGWRELRSPDDDGRPWASGVEVALVAEQLGRGLADVPFVGPIMAAELRRRAGLPSGDGGESMALPGDGTIAADLTRGETTEAEPLPELAGDDLAAWTALGLAITAADLVGVMDGATRLACDYARDRHQYGVAVGSFQAVQHLLADAHVLTEGSRSATLRAAWAVDALPADEALAAGAVAKAYASRSARTVCETAIQVHGGIGNTWECLAHVHLRRALASSELFGGVGPNLERVLAHGLR